MHACADIEGTALAVAAMLLGLAALLSHAGASPPASSGPCTSINGIYGT